MLFITYLLSKLPFTVVVPKHEPKKKQKAQRLAIMGVGYIIIYWSNDIGNSWPFHLPLFGRAPTGIRKGWNGFYHLNPLFKTVKNTLFSLKFAARDYLFFLLFYFFITLFFISPLLQTTLSFYILVFTYMFLSLVALLWICFYFSNIYLIYGLWVGTQLCIRDAQMHKILESRLMMLLY